MSRYCSFFQFPNEFSHLFELVGGGLVRRVGDWFLVFSFRRKGVRVASDYRILGSSEFDQGLRSEEGEEITELRSDSRSRKVSKAVRANSPTHRLFCQLAVGKMGYPGAEVARFLGVTTSVVVRVTKTEELKEV